MRTLRTVRGAALPETALVLTATLAMTFGIIQLGLLGFLQLMADGAAFVAAHEYSLGNTSSYETLAAKPFPLIGSTPFVDLKGPATATVDVNYEGGAQRTGGVTLLRPNPTQITTHIMGPGSGPLSTGIASLANIDVHGAAIEPDILMSNQFYDVEGLGYSGGGNPQPFFGSRLDTPYYYASAHRLAVCTAATFTTPVCPTGSIQLRSLGTAEYVDRDNWGLNWITNNPAATSNGLPFTAMICHQQQYAMAALSAFTSVNSLTDFSNVTAKIYASKTYGGNLSHIYSWDVSFNYNSPGSASVPWGQEPLTPLNNC